MLSLNQILALTVVFGCWPKSLLTLSRKQLSFEKTRLFSNLFALVSLVYHLRSSYNIGQNEIGILSNNYNCKALNQISLLLPLRKLYSYYIDAFVLMFVGSQV